ncbi:hypothetical protein T02_12933 [Trichinella nativa]|uniref:Uncharacterized protein n=1 Tax=Trichinella nativa TaxID=6335 RepID=A0A0V1KIU8_9BILA|nr:hypothetical protein T02_12933 [Trichinella nativa]
MSVYRLRDVAVQAEGEWTAIVKYKCVKPESKL